MIEIIDKKDCCGCWACVQRCPKQSIIMKKDEEGFLYPHVDNALCINCGLCEKVCPVINQTNPRVPLSVSAARNRDENIRSQSSSGGIFSLLAEKVIKEGGVVFGARFNEYWEVVHDSTDTINGIGVFRGSKYVQSLTGDCFLKAEQLLKQNRKVLYSGTPCQIAGLRNFLQRDYDNLITIDVICHGVPSPDVWRQYLAEETTHLQKRRRNILSCSINNKKKVTRIVDISFRDKASGWKKYCFALSLSQISGSREENFCSRSYREENTFMRGFLSDLYLRPSCYHCPSKELKSGSDITIGDFWGIEHVMPQLDDDRGLCCLMVNTERGRELINGIDAVQDEACYEDVVRYNPSLLSSPEIPAKRMAFFTRLPKYGMLYTTKQLTREPLILRCKNSIHKTLKKLGLR